MICPQCGGAMLTERPHNHITVTSVEPDGTLRGVTHPEPTPESVERVRIALAATMDPTAYDNRDEPGRWMTEWRKALSWAGQYAEGVAAFLAATPQADRGDGLGIGVVEAVKTLQGLRDTAPSGLDVFRIIAILRAEADSDSERPGPYWDGWHAALDAVREYARLAKEPGS